VEALSDQLRDVWCGSFKLWVNLSRFGRSDREEATKQTTPNQSDVHRAVSRHGKSFKMALLGGASSSVLKVLHVPVNEELCKELRGSVVGLLAREKDVTRIQTTLAMEGFRSISVTYMGEIWLYSGVLWRVMWIGFSGVRMNVLAIIFRS
jgi:hypothetical protein